MERELLLEEGGGGDLAEEDEGFKSNLTLLGERLGDLEFLLLSYLEGERLGLRCLEEPETASSTAIWDFIDEDEAAESMSVESSFSGKREDEKHAGAQDKAFL